MKCPQCGQTGWHTVTRDPSTTPPVAKA
jgi:hypothetical protein